MAQNRGTFRVLGIDPGLNVTGYAVVDFSRSGNQRTIVEAGTLRTAARADMAERIRQIYEDLQAILAETQPHLVAIEQLYSHYQHPRTAILMAHAGSSDAGLSPGLSKDTTPCRHAC